MEIKKIIRGFWIGSISGVTMALLASYIDSPLVLVISLTVLGVVDMLVIVEVANW